MGWEHPHKVKYWNIAETAVLGDISILSYGILFLPHMWQSPL
jgi:hypothetical protein